MKRSEHEGGAGGQSLQLLDRALKLVFILREYDRRVTLHELAVALGISKSSVHRLLGTLSRLELVTRDAAGRYHVGPKMKELSADVWTEADIRAVALPHMEQLREFSGETVSLHVLDGDTHVVVEQCESHHEVQWTRRVGRAYALRRGANASALLAFVRQSEAQAILARTALPDSAPLLSAEELQRVRRAGYALHVRGGPDGIAIAAPIFARGGQPIGSLCVSGPLPRFDAGAAERAARLLLQKTQAISKAMGLRAPRPLGA
jgi:DNA-binding IclR family transcriptional regulator